MKVKPSVAFQRGIANLNDGLILKPLLEARFMAGDGLPDQFSVHFRNEGQRKPDGWFHPSEHPSWGARKLWLYRRYYEQMVARTFDMQGQMNVTVGNAIHGLLQSILDDMGILVGEEVALSDEDTHARGSADGILDIDNFRYLLEIKTSSKNNLWSCVDLDIAYFRDTWPGYYLQVQEYLRLSGLRKAIVLFFGLGHPWPMVEYHVEANDALHRDLREKFTIANEWEDMPEPCCGAGSKEARSCAMRNVCPVGLA